MEGDAQQDGSERIGRVMSDDKRRYDSMRNMNFNAMIDLNYS